jgi:sugar phosphate isomerase/epimerase
MTVHGRLGRDDLIASIHSVARHDRQGRAHVSFPDRVANTAAAGFQAIATTAADYLAVRDSGLSDEDVETLLDDNGLVFGEIDSCPIWVRGGRPDARHRALEDATFHIAERFGPVHHTVVPLGTRDLTVPSPAELAPDLRRLSERAAAVDMLVSIEFVPWGPVPDAPAAWAYAAAADHPACGVNVDFWHHLTGAASEEALRAVPRGRVHSVHFTDGHPDLTEPDALRRTMTQRRIPGDGVFPMEDTVRLLDALGVDVPFTVEVVSLPHRALSPAEFADLLYRSSRSVLDSARSR